MRTNKMVKKFLSTMLCIMLVLSLMPVQSFANTEVTTVVVVEGSRMMSLNRNVDSDGQGFSWDSGTSTLTLNGPLGGNSLINLIASDITINVSTDVNIKSIKINENATCTIGGTGTLDLDKIESAGDLNITGKVSATDISFYNELNINGGTLEGQQMLGMVDDSTGESNPTGSVIVTEEGAVDADVIIAKNVTIESGDIKSNSLAWTELFEINGGKAEISGGVQGAIRDDITGSLVVNADELVGVQVIAKDYTQNGGTVEVQALATFGDISFNGGTFKAEGNNCFVAIKEDGDINFKEGMGIVTPKDGEIMEVEGWSKNIVNGDGSQPTLIEIGKVEAPPKSGSTDTGSSYTPVDRPEVKINGKRTSKKSLEMEIGEEIKLEKTQSNSTIYYTLDGTTPSKNSMKYEEPIEVTGNMTLKFIEIGSRTSAVVTREIVVTDTPVQPVVGPVVNMTTKAKFSNDATQTKYLLPRDISGNVEGVQIGPDQAVTRGYILETLSGILTFNVEEVVNTNFTDVNAEQKALIDKYVSAGIIVGNADGTLGYNSSLTKGQLAVILCNLLGLSPVDNQYLEFKDTTNHWAKGYLSVLRNHGYLVGDSNGNAYPDKEVSLAEFVSMINEIVGTDQTSLLEVKGTMPTDIENHWAKDKILAVVK